MLLDNMRIHIETLLEELYQYFINENSITLHKQLFRTNNKKNIRVSQREYPYITFKGIFFTHSITDEMHTHSNIIICTALVIFNRKKDEINVFLHKLRFI